MQSGNSRNRCGVGGGSVPSIPSPAVEADCVLEVASPGTEAKHVALAPRLVAGERVIRSRALGLGVRAGPPQKFLPPNVAHPQHSAALTPPSHPLCFATLTPSIGAGFGEQSSGP